MNETFAHIANSVSDKKKQQQWKLKKISNKKLSIINKNNTIFCIFIIFILFYSHGTEIVLSIFDSSEHFPYFFRCWHLHSFLFVSVLFCVFLFLVGFSFLGKWKFTATVVFPPPNFIRVSQTPTNVYQTLDECTKIASTTISVKKEHKKWKKEKNLNKVNIVQICEQRTFSRTRCINVHPMYTLHQHTQIYSPRYITTKCCLACFSNGDFFFSFFFFIFAYRKCNAHHSTERWYGKKVQLSFVFFVLLFGKASFSTWYLFIFSYVK